MVLPDGNLGQVTLQAVDVVNVVLLGGAEISIPTPKFLELGAQNVSRGFRHSVSFGIDYQHQSQSTTEIPKLLRSYAAAAIGNSQWAEALQNLSVEFQEAAASSLNYCVNADFSGEVAADYYKLSRFLHRTTTIRESPPSPTRRRAASHRAHRCPWKDASATGDCRILLRCGESPPPRREALRASSGWLGL